MKICLVALNIYPFFDASIKHGLIGGAELQQVYIGKGLQKLGYEVSYITMDYGQSDRDMFDNCHIYKAFSCSEGIWGIRYFYPRLYKLWKAIIKADADIYYARSAGFIPALLSIYCKIYGKKFIYAGAHDTDFIPDQTKIPTIRDKFLYRWGLKRATQVIVQSKRQQKLLWRNYKKKSRIIYNFSHHNISRNTPPSNSIILWVATMRKWKRPELFIQVARNFPHKTFVMIGGKDSADPDVFEKAKDKCQQISNIKFLGFQPLEKTEQYFDQATLFVNTSLHEGFPNTFLQAWRRGIPVVSFVDPDNIISKNKLGSVVSDREKLISQVDHFLTSPGQFDPDHIRGYFFENHYEKNVINQYKLLIGSI